MEPKKKVVIRQLDLFKDLDIVKLKLKAKKVYGVTKYYPECKSSQLIVGFMDRIVFTQKEIDQMKEIGWELEVR